MPPKPPFASASTQSSLWLLRRSRFMEGWCPSRFPSTGQPKVSRAKLAFEIKALTEKIKADGWDTLNSWEPDFSPALGA